MGWSSTVTTFSGDVIDGVITRPSFGFTFYETSGSLTSATTFSANLSADINWVGLSLTSAGFTSGGALDSFDCTVSFTAQVSAIANHGDWARGNVHVVPEAGSSETARLTIPVNLLVHSSQFSTSTIDLKAMYDNPPLWGGSLFRR